MKSEKVVREKVKQLRATLDDGNSLRRVDKALGIAWLALGIAWLVLGVVK